MLRKNLRLEVRSPSIPPRNGPETLLVMLTSTPATNSLVCQGGISGGGEREGLGSLLDLLLHPPHPPASPLLGSVPLWEEVLHPIELLQVQVELEEALGRGLGHAAVHLVQLLLDMLCNLAGIKGRRGGCGAEVFLGGSQEGWLWYGLSGGTG